MLVAAAAERNKAAILAVLRKYIDSNRKYKCLEIASGVGTHVAYFAKHLSNVEFQPSEHNIRALHSIVAYVDKLKLSNIRVPLYIDVAQAPDRWALPAEYNPNSVDIMFNINMIHISSNAAVDGLFRAAEGLLCRGTGLLITYGPFAFGGQISPNSNVAFDAGLRQQSDEWGLKDVDELKAKAKENSLNLIQIHEMPANNHTLVFQRSLH